MSDYDSILLIIKAVVGVIIVIAITVYVLKPLVRNLSGTGEGLKSVRSDFGLRRNLPEEEFEIPTKKLSEVSKKRMIIQKALDDPLTTTQLVRNWLREKK